MNDFVKTEFLGLVTETSQQVTNEQMSNAYGKFIVHIDTISQIGNDLIGIIRKLNITRIELLFLSTQIQYEQGEKCA
ncbi:hypothetical protein [Dysgonomonas mossii]|uniref:hypothetical protein n=1 Tax=Dysgonomonas mossii TaxID=163665 RepID=UPI0026ED3C0A|nr:hypothetical protein [Dysgonomonas mossii]